MKLNSWTIQARYQERLPGDAGGSHRAFRSPCAFQRLTMAPRRHRNASGREGGPAVAQKAALPSQPFPCSAAQRFAQHRQDRRRQHEGKERVTFSGVESSPPDGRGAARGPVLPSAARGGAATEREGGCDAGTPRGACAPGRQQLCFWRSYVSSHKTLNSSLRNRTQFFLLNIRREGPWPCLKPPGRARRRRGPDQSEQTRNRQQSHGACEDPVNTH